MTFRYTAYREGRVWIAFSKDVKKSVTILCFVDGTRSWNCEVYIRESRPENPLPVAIPSNNNPIHIPKSYFHRILFNIIHSSTPRFSEWCFPFTHFPFPPCLLHALSMSSSYISWPYIPRAVQTMCLQLHINHQSFRYGDGRRSTRVPPSTALDTSDYVLDSNYSLSNAHRLPATYC